jgi:hypothetical protein
VAKWVVAVQVTLDGDTPDEAIAWLEGALARRLEPGEEGRPWQAYGQDEPRVVPGSVQQLHSDRGVPRKRAE